MAQNEAILLSTDIDVSYAYQLIAIPTLHRMLIKYNKSGQILNYHNPSFVLLVVEMD